MTVRVITGSKQEIAKQVASLEGEVREVIVLFDEPSNVTLPENQSVEELFAEMEPYTVKTSDFDDSREAIYTRMEGE